MLFKTKNTARAELPSTEPSANKEKAKACLREADKALKDLNFQAARNALGRAKELDPANPYLFAFEDRINHFEEEEQKKQAARRPFALPLQETIPQSESLPKTVNAEPTTPPPKRVEPRAPLPSQAPPVIEPFASTPRDVPKAANGFIAPPPIQEHVQPPPLKQRKTPEPARTEGPSSAPASAEVSTVLEDMRRQIEELSRSLEQEKKAREEISERQLQSAVKQFRVELEKAWVNGAPKEPEEDRLHQLASSLGISAEVEQSLTREVKLDMYSRAVKEMVSKRKLLRSSSSTLEWLRKVYRVSVAEYLENESKFLLDLVADQYKGTLLLVTEDEQMRKDLAGRLKAMGYAVVHAQAPEAALEKIEKVNPNLILCEKDFSNGSLSGLKFLNLLRVNPKFNFIPFVFFCRAADLSQLQSSELRPNEGIVQKPVDVDALNSVMNEKLNYFREYISSLA